MVQTNKLLLICVETRKTANTDTAYIDKALKYLYKIDNDIKMRYVYFKTKSVFIGNAALRKIKNEIRGFSNYTVVYCVDTDNETTNLEDHKLNKSIGQHCLENDYEFVWFCRDVEEVFLHRRIPQSQKIAEAKKFGSCVGIGKATKSSLSANKFIKQKSNFKCVFDKFLDCLS